MVKAAPSTHAGTLAHRLGRAAAAFAIAALLYPASPARAASQDALDHEVSELNSDPVLRPVHTDLAVAGTFDMVIERWVGQMQQSAAKFQSRDAQERLDAYFDGRAAAPGDWVAEVRRVQPMLNGALSATHCSGARLPTKWHLAAPSQGGPTFNEFQHLARLGLLDARMEADQGMPTEGLRRCADVMGLLRDLSWGPLGSAMVAREMLPVPMMVCGDIAREAPVKAQEDFVQAVSRIRLGWGARKAVVRWERIREQMLIRSGAHLAPTTVNAGTPAAVAASMDGGVNEAARKSLYEAMTKLMQLVGGNPQTTDPEIAKLDVTIAGVKQMKNSRWVEVVRNLRDTEARMETFHAAIAVEAYRSARGVAPKRWSDVFPEGAPMDPRTGDELVLDLDSPIPMVRAKANDARGAMEIAFKVSGMPTRKSEYRNTITPNDYAKLPPNGSGVILRDAVQPKQRR